MQIRFGAVSDTGRKRTRNEDAFLAWAPEDSWLNGFFVVADGMGGHEAGDVASQTTIQRLQSYMEEGEESHRAPGPELLDGLEQALLEISSHLREMAAEKGQTRGMGSTATAAAFTDRQIHIAHVGDTRLYRLRDGVLHQLTLDHSWVAEQERRGWISAEQAANHPQKNILTQALGTEGELEVFKKSFPVRSKDRYLICSDGLHGAASIEQVQSTLTDVVDPGEAVQGLVDFANAAGGPDNVTAIVCDALFSEEEAAAPPLPAPEDDGVEVVVPGHPGEPDARPKDDPEAARARRTELESIEGSPAEAEPERESHPASPPAGVGSAGRSSPGGKLWIVLGIALAIVAIAVLLLR